MPTWHKEAQCCMMDNARLPPSLLCKDREKKKALKNTIHGMLSEKLPEPPLHVLGGHQRAWPQHSRRAAGLSTCRDGAPADYKCTV